MAANTEEDPTGTRKSKRKISANHPKLLLGEKVEVRSMEVEFLGSWHGGTVVSCDYEARRVQYDNIDFDDESGRKLVESVKVTPAINGSDSVAVTVTSVTNYRGSVRPRPPAVDLDLLNLRYGQCVDVYYRDAYWEGVVFDQNEGSENRSVIFPDIGDVMLVPIYSVRISQDWDEVQDVWEIRKNWVLIELVEEIRAAWPLHVSVREIWYEVRTRKRFINLKEWTSRTIDVWKESVFEVISEFQSLALKHLFKMIDSEADEVEEEGKDVPNPNGLQIVSVDNGWVTAGSDVKYDPNAVSEYISSEGKRSADLIVRIRQHLASLGWNLDYRVENRNGTGKEMIRMRYTNPQGKVYMSLVTACRSLMDNESGSYDSAVLEYIAIAEKKGENRNWYKSPFTKVVQVKVRKHLAAVGWVFLYSKRNKKELRYISPKGSIHTSLIAACKQCVKEGDGILGEKSMMKGRGSKSKKNSRASSSNGRRRDSRRLISKGVRQNNTSSNSQTVLAWLVDNKAVLPRATVFYFSITDNVQLAEGMVTRDGIKCVCCGEMFSLTKFEVHANAGVTNRWPAGSVFLEDGRSLLQCQLQLRSQNELEGCMNKSKEIVSADDSCDKTNDSICSICRIAGELILCDGCPSSYHIGCLGLNDVPDGDWFCPSCCCACCGRIQLSEDADELHNDRFVHCEQCQHNYHIECLKERAHANPGNIPMGNCFCSKKCEDICLGLSSRLGKRIPVKDDITWTLWKGVCSTGGTDLEAESYGKLNVALNVMHECFEPFKDSETGRDLVEDVIFCQRSELNRMNFEGFFTVILEEDDELVSVATVRIHGEKVAELPLVATRFQHRRSGKCRIMINELEKMLVELGIQRLVLPAVSSVLDTWKNGFGFSEMSDSQKLMYLSNTFLDFEGTVMCQKLLLKEEPSQTSENMTELAPEKNGMDLGANKTVLAIENSKDNLVEENRKMEQISSPNGTPHQDVGPVVPSAEMDGIKIYKRRCRFAGGKTTRVWKG